MTRTPAASRRARLLGAVAVAALLAALLPPATGAAAAGTGAVGAGLPRATTAPDPVRVALTGLSPLVPTAESTLVVSGTVTNTTGSDVTGVSVGLRLSPTPVRDRAEIPQILAGQAGRTGVAVAGSRLEVATDLPAGTSASFRITLPMAALGLPADRAEVVVLGVESIGSVVGDGLGPVQTGFTRVFLPWFPPGSGVTPTPVLWLYPLSSAPSRLADGVFLDDHLATEVAAGGRLSRLLDAAAPGPANVTWVVDPALLQSLEEMSDGYRVRAPGGTTTPGTGAAAAAAFLARLRSLVRGAGVASAAYANPDIVALHRSGLDLDIPLASTTESALPASLLATPVTTGLSVPPGGVVDDGTLDVLRAAGTRVVVLSGAQLPASGDLTFTPSGSTDLAGGSAPLRAALYDPLITPLVAAPNPRDAEAVAEGAVVRRQEALAQIAMTTLELPSTPRTLVLAPPMVWSAYGGTSGLVAATSAGPWSRPLRLDEFTAAPASQVPRTRLDYPESARAAELPLGYLAGVKTARADLAALRSVAPDTSGATDTLEQTLTRAESAAWRADLAAGRALVSSATESIDAQTAKVRVLSRAPVTLPGDTGVIPVTVANDLDRPARVGVRLVGTPSARFEATEVPAFTIAPGKKTTLEVKAKVVGSSEVSVDIQLLTPDGQPFGVPVTTSVRSAAYASAAAWVVGGLFGILVLLLAVNFVRRRRPGPVDESGQPPLTEDTDG